MLHVFRAFLSALAMIVATVSTAQTATDTMTVAIDGSEAVLQVSPTFVRAPSSWSTMDLPASGSPVKYVDEINVIGYVLDDNAVEMQVHVYFAVWNVDDALRIEQPSIDISRRGDAGRWGTVEQEDPPVITLTTYERSDSGVLAEASFSGNPVYWPTIYKKPEERGPSEEVSGSFSIFFPAQ